MGKTTKKTTEEYQRLLDEKHNGKIKCVEEYQGNAIKIMHKCLIHDFDYPSTPQCILASKTGCPKCGEEVMKMKAKSRMAYTDEEYKKALYEKFGGNIENLEPCKGSNQSILHICHRHNYQYTSSPHCVLRAEYGCKYCAGEHQNEIQSFSLEKVKQMIFDLVGDEYEIVGEYVNMPTTTQFKHNAKNGEVHYFDMTPTTFFNRGGRCYCENNGVNRLIVGFNDINTTRPDIAKCLHNKEDAFKYTMHYKGKLEWDCPECSNTFKESPSDITSNRLSCPFCSDGVSYPNKFMFNSMSQIEDNLDFLEREPRLDWCLFNFKGKQRYGIYDIYFGIGGKEYIVEMDGGLGHGNKVHKNSELTQEELLQIDMIKDNLAKEQGIKVIRIDCDYKTDNKYSYILNNVLNSELKDIIDLSKIDFDLSNKNSVNSLIVKTGELWNKGLTAGQIRKELKIGEGTVTSYLKTASEIGICDYSKEESKNRSRCRKVYCTTLGMLFNGATEAQRILGVDRTSIRRCCTGEKTDTKGRTDDERLQWLYYEDYLKSTPS